MTTHKQEKKHNNRMINEALKLNADAIVGVRFFNISSYARSFRNVSLWNCS
jgi:uncharacterized protein YbjQ (UPF0145 family)